MLTYDFNITTHISPLEDMMVIRHQVCRVSLIILGESRQAWSVINGVTWLAGSNLRCVFDPKAFGTLFLRAPATFRLKCQEADLIHLWHSVYRFCPYIPNLFGSNCSNKPSSRARRQITRGLFAQKQGKNKFSVSILRFRAAFLATPRVTF